MVKDYGGIFTPLDSGPFKMGGGSRSLQNPKKKPNFGGNTHVTLNPASLKP